MSLITLTDEQITEIVQGLRGTTGSLDLTIEAVLGMPDVKITAIAEESLQEIDAYIFLCEVCGWWCDRDEEDETSVDTCDECASDYVDEDEEIYEHDDNFDEE